MSYAEKYLNSKGQDCVIHREPPVPSKVSKKRSTKASRDLGIREGYWEGLIPVDVRLVGGEVLTIYDRYDQTKYLVQSTNYDPQSMQTAFFSAKCNIVLDHLVYVDDVDDRFNPIQEWQIRESDINVYGEVITSRIRQEDPGLLEGTIYILQVPKRLNVEKLDRVVFNETNYRVISVDDIGMEGIARLQLDKDFRE